MNTALAKNTAAPMLELRDQLTARTNEFANALPSHIKPEYFQRATLTAIAQNPQLLDVDRRSLFNSLMRCAQDGLIPDGRQAALVIFKDRERGPVAQYMQMIAGVRHLVQQSGEITRFEQTIVHANDKFEFMLGDCPRIHHRPTLTDRGPPILVYSIAQFRDGTLSREVMTVDEIEKVRGVSRSKDGGPWRDWWSEMAKKTIAKRHAKILPMSNDAGAALARDDAEHFELPAVAPGSALPPQTRPRLADQLDALAPSNSGNAPAEKPKRGRTKKNGDEIDDAEIERSQQRLAAVLDEPELTGEEPELQVEDDDGGPADVRAVRHDYEQGKRDAIAGHGGCLNRDIRDIATRYAEWKEGYESIIRKRK
jgi:recombination protein RecT